MLLLHYGLTLPARLIMSCILFLSSLTLAEHIWEIDLGIDDWLYNNAQLDAKMSQSARPAFLSAIISTLLAIGMLLVSLRRHTVAQLLAFIGFTMMYASVLGNFYTAFGLFSRALYVSIRFNVSVSLLLWSSAVLLYEPRSGWMALIHHRFANRKSFKYILCYFLMTVPVVVAAYLFILEGTQFSKASGILIILLIIAIISIPVMHQLLVRLKKLEQHLKKANKKLTIALHASGLGVWDIDLSTGIVTQSEKIAEIFGHPFTEKTSVKRLIKQVYAEDRTHIRREFTAVSKMELVDTEIRILLPELPVQWIHVCGEAETDEQGNPVRIFGTMKNITSRKEKERSKDEFISVVSHELKTPITSIKAQAQLLERKFSGSADQATAMMLKRINLQIGKLTTIITDLLQAGQVEEQKLTLRKEEYLFRLMVEETVAEIQRTTTTHQLLIDNHEEITCIGDKERTCQVLSNLLTNAIKYSPSGDKIIIRLTEQENQIHCSVQDFGLGIAAEKQARIFDRFYRVSGERNNVISGFGLGLYICSQIIRRLNGKIGLSSIPGEGSVFYFSVPKII